MRASKILHDWRKLNKAPSFLRKTLNASNASLKNVTMRNVLVEQPDTQPQDAASSKTGSRGITDVFLFTRLPS